MEIVWRRIGLTRLIWVWPKMLGLRRLVYFYLSYCYYLIRSVGSGCRPRESGRLYTRREIQWLGTIGARHVYSCYRVKFDVSQLTIQTVPQLADEDFVDITWNIVYSGRTPIKFSLSESLFPYNANDYYNMTAEEDLQQQAQHFSEVMRQSSLIWIIISIYIVVLVIIEGLRGNRLSPDYHPRRIFLTGFLV